MSQIFQDLERSTNSVVLNVKCTDHKHSTACTYLAEKRVLQIKHKILFGLEPPLWKLLKTKGTAVSRAET